MPARSERIYLCPRESGHPGWVMEFPAWWDRAGFFARLGTFQQPGSRWFDTGNPWGVDYALLLTMGEAASWDERCRNAMGGSAQDQSADLFEAMQQLRARLADSQWVVVESHEWESGLD